MIGRPYEIARLQSDFYRDKYRGVLSLIMLSVFVILVLISAIIYVIFSQAVPPYYATTTAGHIVPMVVQHVEK